MADELFLGDGFFVGALLVGLAAYGVAYVLRGVCAGVGWFKGYALLLVADGAARLVIVLPLVAVASRDLAAAAMVAAAVASVAAPGRRRPPGADAAHRLRCRDSRSTSARRSRSPGRPR